MHEPNNKQRRRGVQASRVRLTKALTDAGLRTQAALAERIADMEDLDSPPRDAVSRAFRELPVELTTLERIARALNVEVHTLYLTASEAADARPDPRRESPADEQRNDTAHDDDDEPQPREMDGLTMLFALIIVAVLSAYWFYDRMQNAPKDQPQTGMSQPLLDLGTAKLVVQPVEGDDSGQLANALRKQLAEHYSVASPTAGALTSNLATNETAETLRTDGVVEGELVTVGRLSAVRVYLYAADQRHQVWAESFPAVAFADQLEHIATNVSNAVLRATGQSTDDAARHFPLAPVQDDYLEGEYHLDRPSSELNIKRAQSRFEAALRQDANYARAHAGLCQTLLEEHWMASEERALQDAARACGQALQLDADDPVVAAAHAHFLRRTGRNDEAMKLYAEIVERAPKDSAAYYGYANSLLAEWRENSDEAVMEQARAMARKASAVDPVVWKPLFALATMHWFDGDVAAAIATSEAARARDENEYVLANLGSFYLCDGAFENALEAYQAAQRHAPESYVGDEFIGLAQYYLGDYEQSATLRQRAISKVATGEPEIHEMWGSLGDSQRMAGNTTAAIAAYRRAAEIAERDYLRGTQPAADQAARAWYYTALASLDPGSVPAAVAHSIDDDLDRIEAEVTEASAHRRMAQTFMLRGETDKARAAIDRAATVCQGYRQMPDLAALLE